MTDHRILYGDVWSGLSALDNGSIDCVITSPPYWLQRDYGFKGQIGNEKELKTYLSKLVTIFHLLRKKLKINGVFYLNIGDKYINKYGNTPLGMIPYKLAYFLVKDGWLLSDIIIWYKPNHMPSSVKNRFTNTYEPIFVLTKDTDNYYNESKKRKPFSNVFKVNLQQVTWKHEAIFPEKLVEKLLQIGLPNDSFIVDPFAGSGTTCVAVQNLSHGYFNPLKMHSLMIEANKDYIKIIKARCQISDKNIQKIEYSDYSISPITDSSIIRSTSPRDNDKFKIKKGRIITIIFETSDEFNSFIPLMYNNRFVNSLANDGILFLGLSDHNITDIYSISKLNASGWIIRNILIIPHDNDWIPIFMLVRDIKTVKYHFNLDAIRKSHQSEMKMDWNGVDFTGYRVEKSQALFKNPVTGLIAKIILQNKNNLPEWVLVKWEKNSYSLEEVIYESKDEEFITMLCPRCSSKLDNYYHQTEEIKCNSCQLPLWRDLNSIPLLKENYPRVEPLYNFNKIEIKEKITKKLNYKGKFKDKKLINLGQSPGARVSVSEQFFSMQHYYNINQSMISDYFNIYRKKMRLTKKQVTESYPPEYKHTVGHWLRKDMGGSIPKYEDLQKLSYILNLESCYVQYISRMGLKLQTVLVHSKGKNPGDFLEKPLGDVLKLLKKVGG